MPRVEKQPEYASPSRPQRSGSKQLTENLSKDELLKRIKIVADFLYDTDQGGSIDEFPGIAQTLTKTFIVKHADKDIRCYAAYCLTHILRIFTPLPPYDKNQLWTIFDLIISQLEGLRKGKKAPSFQKLFNVLEVLAMGRTLSVCVQYDFSDLILKFIQVMFSNAANASEPLPQKVLYLALEIMHHILVDSETISQKLLDCILVNIINSRKGSNQCAYKLASDVVKRSAASLEPHIQMFFNSALFLEKGPRSDLQDFLYDVIYELHKICPSVLLSVLPQLEFKLKSANEDERLEVASVLAKMFSDEDSALAKSHKALWQSYLGRFVDINVNVRIQCTKQAKYFFLHHPELVGEVSEKLRERQRDPDERVRMEVVTTICEAATENISSVPEQLFEIVIERLRDRKLTIRKDTMMCLGKLYKTVSGSNVYDNIKRVSWIPTRILRCYYQNSAEDRLCVERVFFGCLVPVSLGSKDRMKRMMRIYQKLDEHGTKAFNHMLMSRASLRSDVRDLLTSWQEHQKTNSEEAKKMFTARISMITKVLPDPAKTQECLKRLTKMLSDKKLFELLNICVGSGHECGKVKKAVDEVAIKFGAKNPMFETMKALLDRAAPLLIDVSAGKRLVTFVSKYVNNDVLDDDDDDDDDTSDDDIGQDAVSAKGCKALDLLLTCVRVFPSEFKFALIYELILVYLKRKDFVADIGLQILTHIGQGFEEIDSEVSSHCQQALTKLFTSGSPSQVKLAGRALKTIYRNSKALFQRVLENQLDSLHYESSSLVTRLSCLGQIALLTPSVFERHHATIVRDFVVKELLMKDRGKPAKSGTLWCDENELSKETKAKIQGLKLLVNWLRGLQTRERSRIQPVLRMLANVLEKHGDITGGGGVRPCEMSHMRLVAACGILKLARESAYHEFVDIECFLNLSAIMQDPCKHMRELFIKKLFKGLESLKLPLEYLTLFALSAKEQSKEKRQQIKKMIGRCIIARNEYRNQHTSPAAHSTSFFPEYALPYLIYLLSHLRDFEYAKKDSLRDIKAYLWFFMEPVLERGDNYNFMKKLAENVRQTKDARAPDDEAANKAIYTVCDIAIGIILNLSKTKAFTLKDFPGDLVLPKKLFLPLSKGERAMQSYLPKGYLISPVKKTSSSLAKNTPTKPIERSGSASKKKPSQAKTANDRYSETSKPKKIQTSLADILGTEKSSQAEEEGSSEDEEETPSPRKKSRSSRKETSRVPPARKTASSSAMKRSSTSSELSASPALPDEKRARKMPKVMREEKPTRFSPRKSTKPSSHAENSVKNSRISEASKLMNTQMPLGDVSGTETPEIDEESGEDESDEIPSPRKPPVRKTVSSLAKKRTLNPPQSPASAESPSEKRSNISTISLEEEEQTRFSPRRNTKRFSNSGNVVKNTRRSDITQAIKEVMQDDESSPKAPLDKRTKDSLVEESVMNGFSQSPTEDEQNKASVSRETRSPVKKRETAEDKNQQQPLKKSTLRVRRYGKKK